MKQQLKIAVIGVGHLGKHHVEHFCSIKNIVLVGVYDIDKVRAEKISDKYDITCFCSTRRAEQTDRAESSKNPYRTKGNPMFRYTRRV